jgi:hypothetical protein
VIASHRVVSLPDRTSSPGQRDSCVEDRYENVVREKGIEIKRERYERRARNINIERKGIYRYVTRNGKNGI